jgi:RNA polymerase sigma-70 factor (ECF subfamily)
MQVAALGFERVERSRPMAIRDEALPAQWLARARSGDRDAFGELVVHYRPDVQRLCRRVLGPCAECDDASQESFARAHAALASYDPERPFRRWLLAIAAHCAIDALRRRRRESRLFESEAAEDAAWADPGPSPLQHGLSAELRGRLLAAIEAQPDLYRAPLALRYYADLDYEEIAGILCVSRNQVATLLFRARRRLRDFLGQGDRPQGRSTRSSQGREAAAQRGEAERSVGPREGGKASESEPLQRRDGK